MDRFLNSNANKRSRSDSDEVTPASKKPRSCSKQGNVPASVRVAEFGKKTVGSCFVVPVTYWLITIGNILLLSISSQLR